MDQTTGNRIHIGTSGWNYDHWRGPFYSPQLAQSDVLSAYASHFRSAEVNNSFYQLPAEATLRRWRDTVPDGFIFAVKASRYITHMKKLKDPDEPVATLLDRVAKLGRTLGPILFQLPPRWRVNVERLDGFLRTLPNEHRYAFEFRDPSWFDQRVYDLLAGHGAAFCIYDLDRNLSPTEVTADFVYIRLHGPEGAYRGSYDERALSGWADAIASWADQGKAVYCYFDNDEAGYAPQNAGRLDEMLRG